MRLFTIFVSVLCVASITFAASTPPQQPAAEKSEKKEVQPIGSMNSIQTIQYVGGVACKEYGCSAQISKIMGVATFHQECGARVNCTEHAPSYKGSFALDVNQFNTGIRAFLPIAQKHDPVLYEALSTLVNRGGDGRFNHLLSAAAWHGNNARFFKPIETVLQNPVQQAAVGMMLQLMPTQTKRALSSSNPNTLLTMGLSCQHGGAIWAFNVQGMRQKMSCGATGADAIDFIVNNKPAVKRGVAVALGSNPPAPGSLSAGLGAFANMFNQGAFGSTAGSAQSVLASLGGQQGGGGSFNPQSSGGGSAQGQSGQATQVPIYSSTPNGGVVGYATPAGGAVMFNQQDSISSVPAFGTEAEGNPDATISCVSADGKTRVRWSCISGVSVSRGLASPRDMTFTTRGALAGVVTVNPTGLTTYTVQCIKNQQVIASDSCKLKPASDGAVARGSMVLALSASPESPETLRRGKKAMITWSTIRAESCKVEGEGLESEELDGEVETAPLTRAGSYVYTLRCTNAAGDTQTKRTRVEVR